MIDLKPASHDVSKLQPIPILYTQYGRSQVGCGVLAALYTICTEYDQNEWCGRHEASARRNEWPGGCGQATGLGSNRTKPAIRSMHSISQRLAC